jgi:putative Mn2+ efflux pump MntP
MNLITILLMAIGLALDAFTVSISAGGTITITQNRFKSALKVGLFFGIFQGIMPILGWLGGYSFKDYISTIDHWVAFGLLSIIGGKMIYESIKYKSEIPKTNISSIYVLLTLSVATSIDALAAGLSLAFIGTHILIPAIIIAIITFILSFIGVYLGNKIGEFLKNKIGIVGGFILIGIGLKILTDHIF